MAKENYQVLARKWRPQRFEDVVGQEHVTRTLRNAIASGRIHHAFLFIGSRGIGKTTTARILAKALNCQSSDTPTADPCGTCANCVSIGEGTNIDVIEIDGASNNSVEDVREIRENIRLMPTSGRYKIYIIDEVHQLSSFAFNALLKTLEEPPPHGVFILATTESHKIPATIISRCQRFDFRRVSVEGIVALLRGIVEKEGKRASDAALYAVANAAEGGVRDSESILDQLMSYCDDEIGFQDVYDMLGLVQRDVLHAFCEGILNRDIVALLRIVEDIVAGGKDLSQFLQELLLQFRNLLVCKSGQAAQLLTLPEEELNKLTALADRFALTNLIRLVEQFAQLAGGFDSALAQRIALEAFLIRVSKIGVEMSVDTVLEKLLTLGGPPSGAAQGRAPDPPEAGAPTVARPTAPAPSRAATPAPRPKVVLTAENAAREWPGIVETARRASLSVGVWLGRAKPAAVEGDTLILEFDAAGARARDTVEEAECRTTLEEALAQRTENIATFRTVLAAAAEEAGAEPAAEYDPNRPFYARVHPDEAQHALEDPRIAKVVDVFRGRIAEVRHGVSLSRPEGD